MPLLKCEDVTLGYENITLAEHVNWEICEGEYWCVIGQNGAGKSTLMKTLLGLRKPLKGKIVKGDGLSGGGIGYLPQQTQAQRDFPASVTEIVLSGFQGTAGLRPFYTKAEKKTALENMEKMGISDLKNRSYRELSGGQQQRVLLARALCATGKILLLDEPVAGLDPEMTEEMYKLIRKLNKDEGIAIVMITHDMEAARQYAEKILKVEEDGVSIL